jgi:hypothetical protein
MIRRWLYLWHSRAVADDCGAEAEWHPTFRCCHFVLTAAVPLLLLLLFCFSIMSGCDQVKVCCFDKTLLSHAVGVS